MDDIISVILTHLPVEYCIRYQIVCKKWRLVLTSQTLWKAKCQQHWPNYPLTGITDYFKLFLDRGGAHFITAFEQFRRIYYEEVALGNEIHNIPHLTNHNPWEQNLTMEIKRNNGLRFIFTKCNLNCYESGSSMINEDELFEEKTNIKITKMDDYWSEIQQTVYHKNIYVPVRWFRHNNWLFILHESMVENSFIDYLMDIDRFGQLSEKKIARLVKDLLQATKYLSSRGAFIVKPNIIYDAKDDWVEFKLFDFGFSFVGLSPHEGNLLVPPEQGLRTHVDQEPNAAKVNTWIISSFLFQLLVGEQPYSTIQIWRQYSKIESDGVAFPEDGDATHELSAQVKDFIIKMFKMQPADRMSLDDALTHPWLQAPPSTILEEVYKLLTDTQSKYNRHHFLTFDNLIDD